MIRNLPPSHISKEKVKSPPALKLKNQLENFLNDPGDFTCPISKTLLVDPVTISTGHTFERENILQWFLSSTLCPNSGIPCNTDSIVTNYLLKSLVLSYRQKRSSRIRKFFQTNARTIFRKDFLLKYSTLVFRVFKKLLAFDEVLKQKSSQRDILDYLRLMEKELDGEVIYPDLILFQSRQQIEEKQYATALCALKKLDMADLENDPRVILSSDVVSEFSSDSKKLSHMGKNHILYQLKRELYSMLIKVYDHFQLNRYTYQSSIKLAKLFANNLQFVTIEDYVTLEYLGLSCNWSEYCEFLECLESVHHYLYGPEEMFQYWNRMSSTYCEANRWEDQLMIVDKMILNRQKAFEEDESYKFYISNAYTSKCILLMREFNSSTNLNRAKLNKGTMMDCIHLALHYNSENTLAKKILDALTKSESEALSFPFSTAINNQASISSAEVNRPPTEEMQPSVVRSQDDILTQRRSEGLSSNPLRLSLSIDTNAILRSHSHIRTPHTSPTTPYSSSQASPVAIVDSNTSSSNEI